MYKLQICFVVFRKESGNGSQGFSYTKEPGIYTINIDENKVELVSEEGEYPVFSADGNSIYYQTGGYLFGSLTKTLKAKANFSYSSSPELVTPILR